MIDFRYHLVSIIAIFLALALGIVLGTTALNGPLVDGLRSSISGLTDDKRALEAEVGQLQGRVQQGDRFAEMTGPGLVTDRLAGARVVLVAAPDAPSAAVDGLRPVIEAAGGSVVGRLDLRPELLDPASGTKLDDLLARVVPAELALPDEPPVQRAVSALAAALMRTPTASALPPSEAQRLLQAYASADLIKLTPGGMLATPQATLAVLVSGPPPTSTGDTETTARKALVALARALDERGEGAVVAGPLEAAAQGGAVQAVRTDADANGKVSTVDAADTAPGRYAVVLALAEQRDGGTGRYGAGPGVQGPLPTAAPQ